MIKVDLKYFSLFGNWCLQISAGSLDAEHLFLSIFFCLEISIFYKSPRGPWMRSTCWFIHWQQKKDAVRIMKFRNFNKILEISNNMYYWILAQNQTPLQAEKLEIRKLEFLSKSLSPRALSIEFYKSFLVYLGLDYL